MIRHVLLKRQQLRQKEKRLISNIPWMKIFTEETLYDGLYAVCTDLLDDNVADILKVSEGRWQIEECFRIMKTDFSARPVYLQDEKPIQAFFNLFSCFDYLSFSRKKMDLKYTCEELLETLKAIKFAEIQEQGYMLLYISVKPLQMIFMKLCGFRTDYQFITKSKMRTIQKKAKEKNKLLYFMTTTKIAVPQ